MSWCAGCLSWWGPLQRGDLCRWFIQLLIDVWLLVSEVSTLNLILLTTQTMVNTGILPHKENPHGRAGNRTRDLVICSQKLWPLDHEAGRTSHMRQNFQYFRRKTSINYMHLLNSCAPVHSAGWWLPIKHCTQKVKQCKTNLSTVVNCNVLKISLITLNTMLFVFIIS